MPLLAYFSTLGIKDSIGETDLTAIRDYIGRELLEIGVGNLTDIEDTISKA